MTTPADPDNVTIPRAEWDAMQAELRRLRRKQAEAEAVRRLHNLDLDSGRTYTREELAEYWGIRG